MPFENAAEVAAGVVAKKIVAHAFAGRVVGYVSQVGDILATIEDPARVTLDQVETLIKKSGLTQKEVAKKLGITQPKVSLLLRGHLSSFSTDTLIRYLSILGCKVEIRVNKPRSKVAIFKRKGKIAVC